MVILSGATIEARRHHPDLRRRVVVEELHPGRIRPASVDLTLGDRLLVLRPEVVVNPWEHVIDLENPDNSVWMEVEIPDDGYVLVPQGVALAETAERVKVPWDCQAELWGNSSRGRWFLMVHVTAGMGEPGFGHEVITVDGEWVPDPDYPGNTWTLELVNHLPLPLRLRKGMRICQQKLSLLDQMGEPYALRGRYARQAGPTAARTDRADGRSGG